jgi:hypothetical protein
MKLNDIKIKPKTCRECKCKYVPYRALSPVCDKYECKVAYAIKSAEKAAIAREKKAKRETKEKLEKFKSINDLIKEAQVAFNAFIRLRDKDKLCICCDLPYGTNALGGDYDCGHWRSRGAAPHLRFNEDNAHGQRKFCNMYRDGNPIGMRIGMIKRIGLERVEALENDNAVHKWTREELIALKAKYKQMTKELKDAS